MLKKREILLFYVLLTRGGYAFSFYIYHDLIKVIISGLSYYYKPY